MTTYITTTFEGHAAVNDGKWQDILDEAAKHRRSKITVEDYSEAKEWSDQQRKWWKGILLPGLAEYTGDSIQYWESVLKLAVMPDEFQFITVKCDGTTFTYLPSITILGQKKMNEMAKGAVAHLRDESIYGDKFLWVTEPRKELKK
jgi:hypothetical protein